MAHRLDSSTLPPALDLASLTRTLHAIAWRVGRAVPRWVLDHNDFMQYGWLGILSVRPLPHLPAADVRRIHLAAAERKMIDALRAVQDARYPQQGRHYECLVADFARLADQQQDRSDGEAQLIRALDLAARVARLAPRNRMILRGRLHGETLAALGTRLGLTEGRMSQIEKSIVTFLQQP